MKKVRRMMGKEIHRNNSFAAFSAELSSIKTRTRTKSAEAAVFRPTKNISILKENADKLGQLAQVNLKFALNKTYHISLFRLAPRCPRIWPGSWQRSTTSSTTQSSPRHPPSLPRSTGRAGGIFCKK